MTQYAQPDGGTNMMNCLIAGKLHHPTGFLGRLIGKVMARSHETAVRWTISLLNIQPDDHVLEIGFGPGVGIEYAAQKASNSLVAWHQCLRDHGTGCPKAQCGS